MAKKTLFSVHVEYKLHEYGDVRIDKFYSYAFNECHAINCVIHKLREEYSNYPFYLVSSKVHHVFNFVK